MDIVSKVNGDTLSATEFNQIPTELENVITDSGQTPSSGTLDQVSKGVAGYAAQGSVFCTDSGATDAYVLTQISPFKAPQFLKDGMSFKFRTANANTGAATVNPCSLGVTAIKKQDGSTALSAGDIPNNRDVELRYNLAGTCFVIVNNTPITTRGDIIRGTVGGVPQRLAIGTSGQVVTSDGTDVVWGANTATNVASQADQETGTSTTTFVSPGRQQYHASACKAWVSFTTITTTTILASYNVTSLTDNGTGDTTINFTVNFSTANYSFGQGGGSGNGRWLALYNGTWNTTDSSSGQTASTCRVGYAEATGTLADNSRQFVQFFGDQA